jgi:hypothetical protein
MSFSSLVFFRLSARLGVGGPRLAWARHPVGNDQRSLKRSRRPSPNCTVSSHNVRRKVSSAQWSLVAEVAARRKHDVLRCPVDALKVIGLDGDSVTDIILWHLLGDHVGTLAHFPEARFHLQEPDLHYAGGRFTRYQRLQHSFEIDDIVTIVRRNHAGRVIFRNGSAAQAPGITLHAALGGSAGLQFVCVH